MNSPVPQVKFSKFLKINLRPYTLAPDQDANLVGVKWYGEGPFHREYKPALNITKKSHFVIKAGDVIYNKLFAWKGSFGIVPQELDGMYVSDKFPTYMLDRTQVDENYLKWYFHYSPLWDQARDMSTGSAALSKFTLNPPKFLELTMSLPSLVEQQRVARNLELLKMKVDEALKDQKRASEEVNKIMVSKRDFYFSSTEKTYGFKKLDSLCKVIRGASPRPKGDLLYYGGHIPRLLIADITRDGKFVTPSIDSLTEEGAKLSRPMRKGDLVLAISGSYGVPAFLAVDACIHDGFIGFLEVDSKLDLEFLYQVLLWRRPYFDDVVKNSGLKNLTTSHLKNLTLPLPPLSEQHRIVAHLDRLQAKVDEVKRLQADTERDMVALVPAVLAKAFGGGS